jgi:hypothetical protein
MQKSSPTLFIACRPSYMWSCSHGYRNVANECNIMLNTSALQVVWFRVVRRHCWAVCVERHQGHDHVLEGAQEVLGG